MKRRTAYAAFERMVLNLYEQRILTLDLLDCVASQYRPVSIDTAGSQYLQTRDGKDLHQVCIELIDPAFPIAARGASEDHEEYWELELKKWEEIVHERWGWQNYCTGCPAWTDVALSLNLPSTPNCSRSTKSEEEKLL